MRDVDKLIEDLKTRTKGKYITQGVAFNKECPRQMSMLKDALSQSASFSGLVKEMLALRFTNNTITRQPTFVSEVPLKAVASAWLE